MDRKLSMKLLLGLLIVSAAAFGQSPLLLLGNGTGGGGGGGGACTPASGSSNCVDFMIRSAQVGGNDLTNYDAFFSTTLGSGIIKNASCFDFVMYSDSASTTKIPWKIITCNQSTGLVEGKFLAASVSHTSDASNHWYASVGNASITTAQNTSANSPDHIWGNGSTYQVVYGLDEASGASGYADSTVNANNGTHSGNDPTAVSGLAAGAQSFNGTSSNVNSTTTLTLGNTFTVEVWVNFASLSGFQYFLSNGNGSGITFSQHSNSHIRVYETTTGGSNNCTGADSTVTLSTATWYHVLFFWDGTTNACKLYINGAQDTGFPVFANGGNPTFVEGASNLSIGGALSGNFLNGTVDEIKFSVGDKTAQALADYNALCPSRGTGTCPAASFMTATLH